MLTLFQGQGNFLELFTFLASHNEVVSGVSFKKAPQNNQLTSSDIQKGLVNSCVVETVNVIMKDLCEELFIILIDEARDTSVKEQMSISLRYVDKRGCLHLKHHLGIFGKHRLSFMRLCGQGYDGASNMQGQFNCLKALILNENESTIYAHCFAHKLKLALAHVLVIKRLLLGFLSRFLVESRSELRNDRVKSKISTKYQQKGETQVLLDLMHSFEFCFIVHLMMNLLGMINDLSKTLQRKDQDIVNVLSLLKVCKERLQRMRECGWDSLFVKVSTFCTKHGINVPQMEAKFVYHGRSRRNAEVTTDLHYYQVRLFYRCINKQRIELYNRFDKFYPDDFSEQDRMVLRNQLKIYEIDMKFNITFASLKGINNLATTMVQCGKNVTYNLVYRLTKLSLILPVSIMNIVKNRLRNRMGDEWMNDCLVTYIEKDVFDTIDNEPIIRRFQDTRK
ncbi:hypothetical protein AQUCO_16300001v1 [Aquilegia coerulea]|uniref:DUF4371 domain-containing protein n=1 Tax=Aquilegia coerulea TaxID=218851 RepID=A0A2G5C245_AQUCA|nr:hypothetical protein AQUCO_16300001v1 [Aquilegia coerulea]